MLEGQQGRAAVIQDDVRDALHLLVAGNGDGGQCRRLCDRGIHRDEPFHAAREQHLRVGLQEFSVVAMNYRQKEKVMLPQILLDAADDQGAVSVADFFGDYADGIGALHAERARQKIRAVVEFARRGENALLGVCRNGTRRRRIIENGRYRSWREAHVFGNRLERYASGSIRVGFRF